jgi:hypothetical protein
MATISFADYFKQNVENTAMQQSAAEWFRQQSETLRKPVRLPERILNETTKDLKDRLTNGLVVGRMYLFLYDAKTKNELPYYDRLPLIFPFRKVPNGFYGINLHYLPPILRARLMDSLITLANNKKYDDTTKLRLSYSLLNRVASSKLFLPCVKHYLNNHTRSRFLWVPASQWNSVIFLPLERFVGARREKVWRDSQRMVQR